MAGLLRYNNLFFAEMEGVGHMPIDERPKDFAEAVLEFISV